jgi:hypothetical protein
MSRGTILLSSSMYNGVTIQKKKLHGKVRISFILAIKGSHYRREETCNYSLFLLRHFSFTNLVSRFLLRGEGCDIPSVIVAAKCSTVPLQCNLQCILVSIQILSLDII